MSLLLSQELFNQFSFYLIKILSSVQLLFKQRYFHQSRGGKCSTPVWATRTLYATRSRVLSSLLKHNWCIIEVTSIVSNRWLYNLQTNTNSFSALATSCVLTCIDSGHFSLLSLLDLSAIYDTVDHDILLQRLYLSFGLSSTRLEWMTYLIGRQQCVRQCRLLWRYSRLSPGTNSFSPIHCWHLNHNSQAWSAWASLHRWLTGTYMASVVLILPTSDD